MYAAYARVTEDPGLRKFLQSMAEQERSHKQYLGEELKKAGSQTRSNLADLLADAAVRERFEPSSYGRTEFLRHAMEEEQKLLGLYKRLWEASPSEELATFFHSMYIEEQRHYKLVKDRYELDSLLSS
jgi:rubrerythrin